MLENFNGTVPAFQADSHGIQTHSTAALHNFNLCWPGCGARASLKSNVFIGRAFVIWTFDQKFPDYRPRLFQFDPQCKDKINESIISELEELLICT